MDLYAKLIRLPGIYPSNIKFIYHISPKIKSIIILILIRIDCHFLKFSSSN